MDLGTPTTITVLPSGVKYRVYGPRTAIGEPGVPVLGSMGVTLPSCGCRTAVFTTHNVLRS